ncbi:MAG: twin-arginine translocase subunit TatB, partial [Chloroflexi bacterium]|nr:twin-arginine translocase subunit TatB [Chloroflexota bacterium]
MFDMGPLEILLILIVALIIWGPGRIPEIARTLGRMVRSLRKLSSEFTTTITKELDAAEKQLPQS